jgi:1,4-alpha-glucan branching enzyme
LTDSGLTDFDLYLFGEGKHERIYDKLGAHAYGHGAAAGTRFAVWAPNAVASPEGAQGYPYSLRLNLPPLGAMFLIGPA